MIFPWKRRVNNLTPNPTKRSPMRMRRPRMRKIWEDGTGGAGVTELVVALSVVDVVVNIVDVLVVLPDVE